MFIVGICLLCQENYDYNTRTRINKQPLNYTPELRPYLNLVLDIGGLSDTLYISSTAATYIYNSVQ